MESRLFSLVAPPPPGFALCQVFSRRVFRSAPFALVAPGFAQAESFLGDEAAKLAGVIVVLGGDQARWEISGPLLLHAGLPLRFRDDLPLVIEPMLMLLERLQESANRHTVLSREYLRSVDTKNDLSAESETIRIGLLREIGDRREAESRLRESEARYQELFENANDMIYTHDLAGTFTTAG